MRRKLFTLAAGVSGVLCMVVCVLWVRSRWHSDCLWWRPGGAWGVVLQSSSPHDTWPAFRGVGLSLSHNHPLRPPRAWWSRSAPRKSPPPPPKPAPASRPSSVGHENEGANVVYIFEDEAFPPGREVLGVRFGWGERDAYDRPLVWFGNESAAALPPETYAYVIVPYWLAALLFAAPAARRAAAWWCRLRRTARGLCPACGYDLRASAGRCPECGTAVPKGATA